MGSAEGDPWLPGDLDDLRLDDLDDDAAPQVRRFLEAVARARTPVRRAPAGSDPQDPAIARDAERRVMRFAYACEELNVAFGSIDAGDPQTMELLVDHGVGWTLEEVAAKAVALNEALDRA